MDCIDMQAYLPQGLRAYVYMEPIFPVLKKIISTSTIYPANLLGDCFFDINRIALFSSQANVQALQSGKYITIKDFRVLTGQSLSAEGLIL